MIVQVTPAGVSVHDADDCTRLSVDTALAGAELEAALRAHGAGERAGGAHGGGDDLLLDVAALHERARAAASAPDWESRWTAMIDYATRKGWLSADGTAVRAHVERAGG
jgi:hypothetical protein